MGLSVEGTRYNGERQSKAVVIFAQKLCGYQCWDREVDYLNYRIVNSACRKLFKSK